MDTLIKANIQELNIKDCELIAGGIKYEAYSTYSHRKIPNTNFMPEIPDIPEWPKNGN